MVTLEETTLNSNQMRIHSGCGGTCRVIPEHMLADIKKIASTAIAEFIGRVEVTFHPSEIRAFIMNDKGLITNNEVGTYMCDTCSKCSVWNPTWRITVCSKYNKMENPNCKTCGTQCPMKGQETGQDIVNCKKYSKKTSICDDCVIEPCDTRGNVSACGSKVTK